MRHNRGTIVAVVALGLVLVADLAAQTAARPADLLLLHGRIYTSNPAQPWAQALAIAQGKIVAVGSNQEIAAYRGPASKVIELASHMVMPGMIDSHIHMVSGSAAETYFNLRGAHSIQEIQRRISAYAAAHPKLQWLIGRGWSYGVLFGPTGLPNRRIIDAVVSDRPVMIHSYDEHDRWLNSKALAVAGITRKTPNPTVNGQVAGVIVRDPRTGEATGVLEDAANQLVARVIPPLSRQEQLQDLATTMRQMNQVGLTGALNALGNPQWLALFDALRQRGELTLRVYMAFGSLSSPWRVEDLPRDIAMVNQARRRYHDEWLRTGVIKFFADGVIEPHTAAMLKPYSNDPSSSGFLKYSPAAMAKLVTAFDRDGLQVMTHAIGDRAVRETLDAYQAAEAANGPRDRRFRIEHIESISPKDVPRFGALHVIASIQTMLNPNADRMDVGAWKLGLGYKRLMYEALLWQDLEEAGARLALGSDWDVASFNPFLRIQAAVTRRDQTGLPQQALTLEQALAAYTRDAAYAEFADGYCGSLEPGKDADLIVLSQDLFEIPAARIGQTKVDLTMVDGKVVYRQGI